MFKLCITSDLGFEFWQDIPGFEGIYQASTFGRIKNKNRIMKARLCRGGYLKIGLIESHIQKSHIVNRLIGITFLPKFHSDDVEINHIDECKSNNYVENLEWVSHVYNMNYGTRNQRAALNESVPVLQFDLQGNFIARYTSATEAARLNNFNKGNICSCCKNKRSQANGYTWKYA